MNTTKNIVIALAAAVIATGTFTLGAGLASAEQGPALSDPIDSCTGYTDDDDRFNDCPVESFASPSSSSGEIKLYGAGCPRAFTDFTGQRWCLFDVSPDEGAINTCSYNNC
jgi:hypothetical protein